MKFDCPIGQFKIGMPDWSIVPGNDTIGCGRLQCDLKWDAHRIPLLVDKYRRQNLEPSLEQTQQLMSKTWRN